jgi:hypothetical protein
MLHPPGMFRLLMRTASALLSTLVLSFCAELTPPFPSDPAQALERTCFQTGGSWSPAGNLRSDVAIVYGIDPGLPQRIETWRQRGYRIHVMTGVSWGGYQDYLYGRFDGINHEDEAQTDRAGNKISHGGDIYYMCPGTNFGKFLCVGVQRALDAGAEAIHLEEPEFWVRSGYSEGFKREWRSYYGEDWQPPHSSVDAQWRTSKLKYFLYRRALQQVFDYVQDYDRRTKRQVRCYVPTHSLLNYSHWRIVSPESSLARLNGCDGYIAQVWTGTSRTPNLYRGVLRERTFETAFLEYGAMQNLVRSTGRRVWYLNDPVEDNPDHDWEDYRVNWESTLVASLLQPDVWQYEVAPWPERVFAGRYPKRVKREERETIPPAYATELQTVMSALNDMRQEKVSWDCGTREIGVAISDSLMFQRGDPAPGDPHLSQIYGLALPLLKRGMPVIPVQLENATIPHFLDVVRVLLLTYRGMKPLSPDVHEALAKWVRSGGSLIVVDDGQDPYNAVREWWNSGDRKYTSPLAHLFEQLGVPGFEPRDATAQVKCGKGRLSWLKTSPEQLARSPEGDGRLMQAVIPAAKAAGLKWQEATSLVLRRGPYVIAAGLEESSPGEPKTLTGNFLNLFDANLRVSKTLRLTPGSRFFLLDLDQVGGSQPRVVASACKALPVNASRNELSAIVEGVGDTQAVVLLHSAKPPTSITLAGEPIISFEYSPTDRLLWVRFTNTTSPRELHVVTGVR